MDEIKIFPLENEWKEFWWSDVRGQTCTGKPIALKVRVVDGFIDVRADGVLVGHFHELDDEGTELYKLAHSGGGDWRLPPSCV